MSNIKEYKYGAKVKITEHFHSSEFDCKCGKKHNTLIDIDLVKLLEELRIRLNAKSGNPYSGYRCSSHDKAVGGSGNGPHTQGYAADIYFVGQEGKRIPSRVIALTLEDMSHKFGIGYRCGGSADFTGNTHIDVKNRKWYGDEAKSLSRSCCNSFYDYFGIVRPNDTKTTYLGEFPILPTRGYFKNNDRGAEVKKLQSFLNWATDSKLSVDGIIGPKTLNAVGLFQKIVGIKQDKLFGKDSLNKAKAFVK